MPVVRGGTSEDRISSPRASERLCWLSPTLKFQLLVVTWAIEINTDSNCNRTTDPEKALGNSSSLDATMTLVTAGHHQ